MSHTGRYLKPARRVTAPGVIYSVAIQTGVLPQSGRHGYIDQCFERAIACYSRKTRGRWSKPKVATFDDPRRLHDWIQATAVERKRNYIVCPCASNTLVLTEFWKYAEECGVIFTHDKTVLANVDTVPYLASMLCVNRVVLRGKPDIFSYRQFSKSYVWVSLSQYFDVSEEVLSGQFGYMVPKGIREYSNHDDQDKRTTYTSVLNLTVFCALSNWWSENATAPFGLTIGQLAMGVLRSHVQPKVLSTHTDSTVHKLERLACYGGRASVWYVGDIGDGVVSANGDSTRKDTSSVPCVNGPCTHLDIRSMYPSILRDSSFPCKLVKRTGPISPKQLRALQTHYHTIAHVRVRIHNAEYPMRKGDSVIYPRGVFQTVLTGADLETFTEKDEILDVYECALYTAGTPYRDAADFLLQARVSARNSTNPAWEEFAKTLANSLGGKLAQRSGHWTDRRDMLAQRQWGEWYDYNADTNTCRKFRSIAGMVSEFIREDTGSGPFTSSFAYLTAYGRQLMRRIRAAFDSETVVSQDTDGLWVLGEIPYDRLVDVVAFGDSPGMLQIKEVSNNGRFYGPKHYYCDSGWVLAGFHNPQPPDGHATIIDTYIQNPILSGCRGLPTTIREHTRSSILRPTASTSGVSPYGWLRDLYIETITDLERI
jgi:hypothetical protein